MTARRRRTPASQPAPITQGEMRIELQLEGIRSVLSAGLLALGNGGRGLDGKLDQMLRVLDRIATAIEAQTQLITRANGHDRPGAQPTD